MSQIVVITSRHNLSQHDSQWTSLISPKWRVGMDFDPGLVDCIRRAKHVVVFTGAGISAESGIPTFRDQAAGLWQHFDVDALATRDAFKKNPAQVWGWYEWRRRQILAAQPNAAHLAIAGMVSRVPCLTLITQNVDDLHERAGCLDVLRLHGSLMEARCFACARPCATSEGLAMASIDELPKPVEPPRCLHCGGRVRPGVVWFGELLPKPLWRRALQSLVTCDVLLVVGTSASVMPAAEIPMKARRHRACVIQINTEAYSVDEIADYSLKGAAGEILPALVATCWPVLKNS